jgi:hypothetical protein
LMFQVAMESGMNRSGVEGAGNWQRGQQKASLIDPRASR